MYDLVEWFTPFSASLFIHAYLNNNPIFCDCRNVGSFALAEDRHGMLEDSGMTCDIETMIQLECDPSNSSERDRIENPVLDPIMIQELLGHQNEQGISRNSLFDRIQAADMDNKDEIIDQLLMQHLGLTDDKKSDSINHHDDSKTDFYDDLQYDNILPDHPVKNTHDDILTDVSSFDDK